MTATPPASPSAARVFTLWCNNKRCDFKADVFVKMSKKCAQLVREGQYQGVIERRIRSETFDAFVAACQLQPFRVTATTAYELQNLAFEWGVTTLEKFVSDFIKQKALEPPPEIDYLGVLIDHVENGVDDPNDVLAVANFANDALRDDRLLSVAPEIIFQVLLAADPQKVDQQLLVNFVMGLFEKNPSCAVPLVLLIDFDRLTKEQRDFIFQCREMHEENIGYFVAQSMSAARNKAERELAQNEAQLMTDLQNLRDSLKQNQRGSLSKLKREQDQSIAELRAALTSQQEQIQDLQEGAKLQKQKIEQSVQHHNEEFADMRGMLEQMDKITSQKNVQTEGQATMIKTEVNDQITELKREMEVKMRAAATEDAKRCTALEDELKQPVEEQQARLKQLRERAQKIVESLNATNEELFDLKSALAAKIVKDRLRFDKFIRQTDNRLEVFTQEPGVWGLRPERVQESEKFIQGIEDRVDQLCPIRGNQNQTP